MIDQRSDDVGLLSAWDTFTGYLRRAGEAVLAPHPIASDLDRAEGMRFLTRLISATFDMYLDYGDPLRPAFCRLMDERRKFFGDNPDADYDFAAVDGAHRYLLTGHRGTSEYLACCVYGRSPDGAATIVANLSDLDLSLTEDGAFAVYLSPDAPPADLLDEVRRPVDWICTTPETENVVIRQYYLDRAHETSATYDIRCLSRPNDHREDPESYRDRLLAAGRFIETGATFTAAAAQLLASSPNQLVIDSRSSDVNAFYPTPDNQYLCGWWQLEEGESLVVEGQAPPARYWSLLVMSHWMESLDEHHPTTSLNRSDIAVAADGSFRVVLSDSDPGVATWLNTAGRRQGYLMFRWMQAPDVVAPTLRVVRPAPSNAADPQARLDPELASLLHTVHQGRPQGRSGQTIEAARTDFRLLTVDLRDDTHLVPMTVEPAQVPGGDGPRDARIYRPKRPGALPTVVFFHGGGFVLGDLDTHEATVRELADQCAAVVVSVDYRLAPEHPFPAGLEDALAATRWALENSSRLGGDSRVAVAGDSAGGNLAAVVSQQLRDDGLAGQLLIYPATELGGDYPSLIENGTGYFLETEAIHRSREMYLGELDLQAAALDPRVSPLVGRLDGLAPAVVALAGFDPLRDSGRAYADALAAAGTPVTLQLFESLVHGFAGMQQYSATAGQAFRETCSAFRKVLHPDDAGADTPGRGLTATPGV